jgi:hypothetical protein
MSDCFIARCPVCRLLWPVRSREAPFFLDHFKALRPEMTLAWRIEWDRRWAEVADWLADLLSLEASGQSTGDESDRAQLDRVLSQMQMLLEERQAMDIACEGSGHRTAHPPWRHGDPEPTSLAS